MLKILQARLQQYVNQELPDVQAGFRKGRRTRDQTANICWITETWKILQEMELSDHSPTSWEIYMQVKKQQLELDMEQQTGSK